MKLILPIPPSNNRYYRHAKGRTYLSKEGSAYKLTVWSIVKRLDIKKFTKKVSVHAKIYPRDNRKRDIDGYQKGLFDALTYAEAWNDDSQIDKMIFERMENDKENPRIEIIIEDIK